MLLKIIMEKCTIRGLFQINNKNIKSFAAIIVTEVFGKETSTMTEKFSF